MTTDWQIRAASPTDFAQWRPLWQQYLAFYETAEDPETTDVTWRRLLDGDEPMYALVAVANGQVQGFAHLIGHRSTWSVSNRLYLNDLFVAESARKQGVARQLIEYSKTLASEHGYDCLYWTTRAGNRVAQGLYDQVASKTDFIQYRIVL